MLSLKELYVSIYLFCAELLQLMLSLFTLEHFFIRRLDSGSPAESLAWDEMSAGKVAAPTEAVVAMAIAQQAEIS